MYQYGMHVKPRSWLIFLYSCVAEGGGGQILFKSSFHTIDVIDCLNEQQKPDTYLAGFDQMSDKKKKDRVLNGMVFPVNPLDGKRSTLWASKHVVSTAMSAVDMKSAEKLAQDKTWRTSYIEHFTHLTR